MMMFEITSLCNCVQDDPTAPDGGNGDNSHYLKEIAGFNSFLEFKDIDLVDVIHDPMAEYLKHIQHQQP